MLIYILYSNIIWTAIIGALVGAGAVTAVFLILGKKKGNAVPTAEGGVPLKGKKLLIAGLNTNALNFSEMYEPLYSVSVGKLNKKEAVFADWNNAIAACEDKTGFKALFAEEFGNFADWKKDKVFVKKAEKLVKLIFKAGIVREHDLYVTADENTAERYELAGTRSIEADVQYDVLAPYWHLGDDIVDKGVIR